MYTSSSDATKPSCIKSSSLTPPCELVLSKREVDSMKDFRDELQRVGVTFDEEEPIKKQQQSVIIHVRTAPSIFLGQSGEASWSSHDLKRKIEVVQCCILPVIYWIKIRILI